MNRRAWIVSLSALAAAAITAADKSTPCKAAPMLTEWGEKVTSDNAWRVYPRPQMVRPNWTCLNGDWDYAITSVTNTPGRPEKWEGKIRVPYPLESTLSGVGRFLEADEFLWYTRPITVHPKKGFRTLLHFDGVDFRAQVYIGHDEVTDVPHAGAQEPFTLDITDYVTDGENELTVCVWDPTDDFIQSRGKQERKPHGCHYTRVSGIWQSVWMEEVPETHIVDYAVTPDIDNGTVKFKFKLSEFSLKTAKSGTEGHVCIRRAGEQLACGTFGLDGECTVKLPAPVQLWSPESPNLYDFTADYGFDCVTGYFGMRKFEVKKDAKGILRFHLNNKVYYPLGTLDQGWWPDGLLTPPSDEAMRFDIETLKKCGFNMMRKHIKVEPRRYYYLCDKIGLLVFQDLPSCTDTWRSPMGSAIVKCYGFQRYEIGDDGQPRQGAVHRRVDSLQRGLGTAGRASHACDAGFRSPLRPYAHRQRTFRLLGLGGRPSSARGLEVGEARRDEAQARRRVRGGGHGRYASLPWPHDVCRERSPRQLPR